MPHAPQLQSTTWTRRARSTTWTRRATAAAAGLLALLAPGVALAAAPDAAPESTFVVRAVPGHLQELRYALAGQPLVRELALIDAEVVRLRASEAASLRRSPVVASVTEDRAVSLASARTRRQSATATLSDVVADIGADVLHDRGVTGSGVDVALIDSGVADVPGLAGTAVQQGVDLTDTAQKPTKRFVDSYGHGTHMAGIIAGDGAGFTGVAPGARIVNVKVADAEGRCDVSQVIAGIAWAIQNAHTGGRDIRVLNLSFGTDSRQDYAIDPLAYAAEQAWHAGIVVVVSAGNSGAHGLTDPASDPYVLAVGAADTTTRVDTVAGFSARGNGRRNPDLVAPGAHVASLRVPGSTLDDAFGDTARTADGLFRGSGTSQAAAVTSGAVALLLQARPTLTPDEVKAALVSTADDLGARRRAQGAGLLDLSAARTADVAEADQGFRRADGSGSLELARGGAHGRTADGDELQGNQTFTGQGWWGQGWFAQSWAGQGWAGQGWLGQGWLSQGWAGQGWLSTTWG